MNKKKNALIIIFLIILTIFIAVFPNIQNKLKEKALVNDTTYWKYDDNQEVVLSPSQFAQYYSTFSTREKQNLTDNEEIRRQALPALTVFSEKNGDILRSFMHVLNGDCAHFERTSHLTTINDRPIALSYVNVIFINELETLELVYEEKTSVLLSFDYTIQQTKVDLAEMESFEDYVKKYYSQTLELSAEQYYFSTEFLEDGVFHLSFGLIPPGTMEEIDMIEKESQ